MKKRIIVVSFPWRSQGPYKFTSDLLRILGQINDEIYLICGNTNAIDPGVNATRIDINVQMHYLEEIRPKIVSLIFWFFKLVLIQTKTSFEIFKLRTSTDIVIFYLAFPYFLLPLITSKLIGKKTIEIITRSKPNNFISKLFNVQCPLFFQLLDGISPESKYLIKDLGLKKYNSKLLPEGARFIDTNTFQNWRPYESRETVIGFIGRLSFEKGILEFIESIPLILAKKPDSEFIIIGEGVLSEEIIKKTKNNDSVKYLGWVSHNDLPDYLNRISLLVIPTKHNEGLPTIILESMACGTPVITTNVGGIPDLIKDRKTGFILNSTSPELMAKDILNALNFVGIKDIIRNSEKLIINKYTFEKAVERYKTICQ